jgi:alpha-mannosidase
MIIEPKILELIKRQKETGPNIRALKSFSTQKLTWGSAFGIPFNLGVWQGVDGSRIFAVLNAGNYTYKLDGNITLDSTQLNKIESLGKKTGLYLGYRYYGVGDKGGAPKESSVKTLTEILLDSANVKVILSSSDLLGEQLTTEQLNKMEVYDGELPLTMHGTGCYTSQAFLKYINRKNELLADATERAMVAADWLQGADYPKQKLNENWTRFIWHQFHDDITGTSIPEAYRFSWNDELICYQQFNSIFLQGVSTIVQAMDTRTKGIPVVVNNALSIARTEPVEAVITISDEPETIRVFNKDGNEVLSQLNKKEGNKYTIIFLATVPANAYEVYSIEPAANPTKLKSQLFVSKQMLENKKYKVSIDANGDISSIYDKIAKKELLSSSARIELLNNETPTKPAWRIYYNSITAKPRNYVSNVKNVEIEETGPVRVSLKITRETEGSEIIQRIRLTMGNTEQRVDVVNDINWSTRNTLLKASFPFTVSNNLATYDLAIGTIKRNNNTENLSEVPGHQWADITHKDGSYGVSILNDGKYGWDKPADSILRLSLLHCPMGNSNSYQTYQDIGKHHFTYSFSGHQNAWNHSSVWQAASLNQPLVAFQTNAHNGNLGKSFSMASVNTRQVAIKALKKAENGNSIVVRLQELTGEKTENVMVSFASAVVSAKELNACEEEIGDAVIKDGKLQFNMKSYQPRTFAVTLKDSKTKVTKTQNLPLKLKLNTRVTTSDNDRFYGEFDVLGNSIPDELLPDEINSEGVVFKLKENSAIIPKGDTIQLPDGNFNHIYLLAAATEDTRGTFKVDDKEITLGIQYYSGFIGNWYFPVFDRPMKGSLTPKEIKLIKYAPAFLKNDNIAWIGTHRHNIIGINEAYTYCYLYKYAIVLLKGAKTLVLPDNNKILMMAITLSKDETINTTMISPIGIKL